MSRNIKKFLKYLILFIMAGLFIFPIYWAVISALKGPEELYAAVPTFFPHDIHWENIKYAWTAQPFTRYFINSVIVTTIAVVAMVFSSSIIAFGFARYEFKFKKLFFSLMLGTMMIPWDVLVIPLYKQYSYLGWIDTYLPLIMPAFFGGAFYIFMLVQFLRQIPKDFDEAAKIEGCNDWQIYHKIFLPIMKPQLLLVAVLYMIVVWNDYLGPLVYLNTPDKFTMAIGLSLYSGAYSVDISSIMVVSVIMIIVPLIAFLSMQKSILDNDISSGFK